MTPLHYKALSNTFSGGNANTSYHVDPVHKFLTTQNDNCGQLTQLVTILNEGIRLRKRFSAKHFHLP